MITKSPIFSTTNLITFGLMALLSTMQTHGCDKKGMEAIRPTRPVAAPVAATATNGVGACFVGDPAITSCVELSFSDQADREIEFLKREISLSQEQRTILTAKIAHDYPAAAARSTTWSSWLDLAPYVAEPTAQKIADTELEFQARLHKLQTVHRARLAREAVILAELAADRARSSSDAR